MFNADLKKRAIEALEIEGRSYNYQYDRMISHIENLHNKRIFSRDLLIEVESYINSIANKPKEYEKKIGEIHVRRISFDNEIEKFKKESSDADNIGGVAGAGALAGAGVAAMGPTAAMAIATTFGTASTGTAISTLSGAAATNAALAWLGGGTLAEGAGGIVGGKALLALAGPIGWSIAGATLLASIVIFVRKRMKLNKEKNAEIEAVKANIERVQEMDAKIAKILDQTIEVKSGLDRMCHSCLSMFGGDYTGFTSEQKDSLGALVNNTKALSAMFNMNVE